MMSLTLDLALNVRGSDPVELLYQAIATQYPQLNLTSANSIISQLIAHPTKLNPDRTRLVIQDRLTPALTYVFTYDRVNINHLLQNPVFTAAQIQEALACDDKQLLAFIGTLYDLNLTEADFFVSTGGTTYTGGQATPNWRLKARYDSVFFHSELIVHLHDGAPLPEEPTEPTPSA
jgi:hypothetical protein